MRNARATFLAFCSSLIFFSSGAHANVTYDITGGNNCYPFGCGPMNYQQVYANSQFGTGKVGIVGISFKVAQDGTGQAFGPTMINLNIDLSTTSVTPDSITGNFGANLGADNLQVFSGNAVISSSGGNVFDITIPFANTFTYDPTQGNLLVGLNVFSSQSQVGQFDAGFSSLVGRNYMGNSHGDYGLATEFLTTNVQGTDLPEPASMALIGVGLLGLALRRKVTV